MQLLFPAYCSFPGLGCLVFPDTSCSEITLSSRQTFSVKSQLYILAWVYIQISYHYQQKLSLNLFIPSTLFVLFVACKLFRAANASCYTENIHPALRPLGTPVIKTYPVSQSKSCSWGEKKKAWSAIFSFLNSAAFSPVSSMFSNTNLHSLTQHWKVKMSSRQLCSVVWEKAESLGFNYLTLIPVSL